MMFEFNDSQREGVSKILDGFFIIVTVTVVTCIFGRLMLSSVEFFCLVLLDIVLFLMSILIRSKIK